MTAFKTLLTVVWPHVVWGTWWKSAVSRQKWQPQVMVGSGTCSSGLPELGCRPLLGAWCSWFLFLFASLSALGAWLVCHPVLPLSIVGGEERLPGCTPVAGLGSEARPGSRTTRPAAERIRGLPPAALIPFFRYDVS